MLYPPHLEVIHERLTKLQERRETRGQPLSQNDVAAGIGMSAAMVSNFLNRKEVLSLESLENLGRLLGNFVEREEQKDQAGLLKFPFAETAQAKEIFRRWKLCHQFGWMGVLLSSSGWGRTTTFNEIRRRDRSVIIVSARPGITPNGLIQDLCDTLSLPDTGMQRALIKRLKRKLCPGDKPAGRCIIIDNAHRLRFGALDMLCYLYDETRVGILLGGLPSMEPRLVGKSEETEQIASRVSSRVWKLPEFRGDDVRLILGGSMGQRELEASMALLGRDEQLMSSGRRLGNLLEYASALAAKEKSKITVAHLTQALKHAA